MLIIFHGKIIVDFDNAQYLIINRTMFDIYAKSNFY